MSPQIVWTYPALAVFYDLRVYQATAVDFDVMRSFDADEGVLRVLHIYRC